MGTKQNCHIHVGSLSTCFHYHQALTFLLSQSHSSPLLNQWILSLLSHNLKIHHKPGLQNILADLFSRNVAANSTVTKDPETSMNTAFGKIAPPLESRQKLLEDTHSFGHFGPRAMFAHLWNRDLWWPSMRSDIDLLVKNCQSCQRYTFSRCGYHPLTSLHADLPWDHLSVDTIGPLPIVFFDLFTKFLVLKAVEKNDAITVAQFLMSVFTLLGFPKILQSDQGSEYLNHVLHALKSMTNMDHRTIASYHPC